jgi:hypothetical protein
MPIERQRDRSSTLHVDDLERTSVAEDSQETFCQLGAEITRNWLAFKVRRKDAIPKTLLEICSKSRALR